jgi:tetratricopeptide (TPR) repeat protein
VDAQARAEQARLQAERDRTAIQASEAEAKSNLAMMFSIVRFPRRHVLRRRPDRHDPDVTVRQMLDRTVVQLDKREENLLPRVEATVRHTLGVAYLGLGRAVEAEAQLRKTTALREAALPANHPAVAKGLATLGTLLVTQRRFDEGVPLLERAMETYQRERIGGADLVDVLDSLQFAAAFNNDNAKSELYARMVSEARAQLGADPRLVRLTNATTEASVRLGRKDFVGAERLLREAMDLNEHVAHGKSDRQQIVLLHNLGLALFHQGRPAEAQSAYEQALAVSDKLLGPDHPEADGTMANLTVVLRSQKKEDEARAYDLRRLGIQLKGLDDAIAKHPEPDLYWERGAIRCRAGRFADGIADFDKSIQLDPADADKYFFAAPIYLYTGDVKAYRRACAELLQRFRTSDRPETCERVAKAWLIEPHPGGRPHPVRRHDRPRGGGGAVAPLRRLVQDQPGPVRVPPRQLRQVDRLAGRASGERGTCMQSAAGWRVLVRAMALARGGRADEARKYLAEVERRFDSLRAFPGACDLGSDYSNWAIYQIVLPQAREVVNAGKPEGSR